MAAYELKLIKSLTEKPVPGESFNVLLNRIGLSPMIFCGIMKF